MKKIFQIVLLAVVVIAASCKKDSLSKNSATGNPIIGQWNISSFVDNGSEITNQFASYAFTFDSNNSLQITGSNMMSMCNWTFRDSVYHFDMMGMHSNQLDAMNDDWRMVNFSDTTCRFVSNNPAHDRMFSMRKN